MPRIDLITLRQGAASEWTLTNPVLDLAEPGYESDTGQMKYGDGSTPWVDLPYFADGGGGGGTDEVWVGPSQPTDPAVELWFDTDAVGTGGGSDGLSVNVKDYGAQGDGVADDTDAIQAAIDSVAFGPGVPAISILMPPGTYKITTTLVINRRAVKLLGAGVGNPTDFGSNPGRATTLQWGGPGGIPMIYVEDAAHVRIADIYFSGRAAPNQPSDGIFFDSTPASSVGTNSHCIVERCWFGWLYGIGMDGYSMDWCLHWGGLPANNDQFVVSNCQFHTPLVGCVRIDEEQFVWGTFYDCYFGYQEFETGRKGLVTSSSTTLVNPQFDGCNPDIEINEGAQVVVLGMQSERSQKVANINFTSPEHSARLIIKGGFCILSWIVGPYFIEHLGASAAGGLDIDGMRFHSGTISPRPKIKVRGVDGASLGGFVSLRNLGGGVEDLDVVGPVGGDGIFVQVDDDGVFDRQHVKDGATYVPNSKVGFYGQAPVAKPTGVAVTAAAIHAALVSLGLIGA